MEDIKEHTRQCCCEYCVEAFEEFSAYKSNSRDRILTMLSTLFDELDLNSFTIVGYRGNSWTVTDSRG